MDKVTRANTLLIDEDITADILEPIEIFGDFEDNDFITSIYNQGDDYGDEYSDDYNCSIELFDEVY
jgi:hypothetical protein